MSYLRVLWLNTHGCITLLGGLVVGVLASLLVRARDRRDISRDHLLVLSLL